MDWPFLEWSSLDETIVEVFGLAVVGFSLVVRSLETLDWPLLDWPLLDGPFVEVRGLAAVELTVVRCRCCMSHS